MGRGNRPSNEFTHEAARLQRQRYVRDTVSPTPIWPSLRVARMADVEPRYAAHEWGDVLNDIGRNNKWVGTAFALGSVSVTLVPAQVMGRMLERKYPRKYHTKADTVDLNNDVRKRIQSFIRSTQNNAFNLGTREVETAYTTRMSDFVTTTFSNEMIDSYGTGEYYDETGSIATAADSSEVLHSVLTASHARIPYAAGAFVVSGLELYGHGYGLDLSENDQMYEERIGLINYLRSEEGLDTRQIAHDGWEAHATVFSFLDHIGSAVLKRKLELPVSMDFDAARPDMC
jgi:hypothetical protein